MPKPAEPTLASRAKALPWAIILRGVVIFGRRWTALSGNERARLAELVRSSRGRVDKLSVKQRLELRKLVRKLDLEGAGRELLPLVRSRRRRRRRLARR